MRTVLFLCTGNYYRSRFAEHFFQSLAPRCCPDWNATSRALAISHDNVGPISILTVEALRQAKVRVPIEHRWPIALTDQEFVEAAYVVAMDDKEHRPMLEERFSKTANGALRGVEYWDVGDVVVMCSDIALAKITSLTPRSL